MQPLKRIVISNWRSPQLRGLWLINALIITLLTLWLLLANSAARSGDRAVQQAWEQFAQTLPQQSSSSTVELERLAAELGLDQLVASQESNSSLTASSDRRAWEAIRQPLNNYLRAQLARPNDEIDPLPADLQQYLSQKAPQIAALRTYLLSNEVPYWGMENLDQIPDYTASLPSFLNVIQLQRILLLTALEQDRAGQSVAALETLAASWKLTQAVSKRPELIGSLVTLIGTNLHAGVLRKLNGLHSTWQTRLTLTDLTQSMVTAFRLESFVSLQGLRIYLQIDPEILEDIGLEFTQSPFLRLQQVFQQPYLRLVAINQLELTQQVLDQVTQQSLCSLGVDALVKEAQNASDWWNVLGWQLSPFLEQLEKVEKALMQWELTGKILQIKALARQTNRPPQNIPGIEQSAVCPDLRWNYKVAPDGTMSIALDKLPADLEMGESDLPLQYSLRMSDLAISPANAE